MLRERGLGRREPTVRSAPRRGRKQPVEAASTWGSLARRRLQAAGRHARGGVQRPHHGVAVSPPSASSVHSTWHTPGRSAWHSPWHKFAAGSLQRPRSSTLRCIEGDVSSRTSATWASRRLRSSLGSSGVDVDAKTERDELPTTRRCTSGAWSSTRPPAAATWACADVATPRCLVLLLATLMIVTTLLSPRPYG